LTPARWARIIAPNLERRFPDLQQIVDNRYCDNAVQQLGKYQP
jgi:hypothetical protein